MISRERAASNGLASQSPNTSRTIGPERAIRASSGRLPKHSAMRWIIRSRRHNARAFLTAYYPYTQIPESIRALVEANMGIAVRSRLAQRDLLHSIRTAISGINSEVPVYDVKTMESMVTDSDSLRNFDLLLLGGFSLLALTLAAVGVYAVVAFSVSRRTREIGIRIALGASSRDVLRLMLQQGATLAIIGSVIGIAGAFFLRRIMASFLYGLSANDPLVLCLVPCLMISVIALACWLPAHRATKIDPMAALRYE
jgi:FtsX-like permease family